MEIRQIIFPGYCSGCQGCCRFSSEDSSWNVKLTRREMLGLGLDKPAVPLVKDDISGQFFCGFFDTAARACSIYENRPFECRLYPFMINKCSGKIYLALDLNCPFARDNKDSAVQVDFIAYMRSFCGSADFKEFLRSNPELAQEYDGALNLFPLDI